jgi:hypothetical protein
MYNDAARIEKRGGGGGDKTRREDLQEDPEAENLLKK